MSTTRSASKNQNAQNAKNYIKKAPNNIQRENLRSNTKKKRLDFTQSKIGSFEKPKKSKFKAKEEDEELNNLNNNISSFEEKITNPNLEMELENHLIIFKNLKPKKGEKINYMKELGTKTESKLVEEISRSDSSIDLISLEYFK